MGRLGYNPNDYNPEERPDIAEGDYTFKVDEAEEVTFKTKNQGLRVKLMVAALKDRDVTVYDQFVYMPKAYWKLDQFLASLGFDFQNPPETHHLFGRTGRARFAKNDRGYLTPEEYYAAPVQPVQPGQRAGGHNYGPPPMDEQPPIYNDDTLPF